MKIQLSVVVASLGLLVGVALAADGPQPYIDRAQWFQVAVPEGWAAAKGQGQGPVLTVRSEAAPAVQLTLEIRRLAQLPALITREALLEQARAILKAVALGRTPATVTELTSRPMAGLIADYPDAEPWQRVTILLDPPRQRAFVWTAAAPPPSSPSTTPRLTRSSPVWCRPCRKADQGTPAGHFTQPRSSVAVSPEDVLHFNPEGCAMTVRVLLERSSEGGYTVSVPALPGCISEGQTRAEALRNIKEAIHLYLEPVEDELVRTGHRQLAEVTL